MLNLRLVSLSNISWLTIFCLLALNFAPYAVPPAGAEICSTDLEQMLFRQFDWVFSCQIEVLDQYLNYESSPAKGLVKVQVAFEPSPQIATKNRQAVAPLKYEELWYQNGRCVGCKRFNNLPSIRNFQGAIYFRDSIGKGTICDHTKEAANAAIRLIADAGIKQSIVQGVFVPWDSYNQFTTDLSRSNFLPIEQLLATGKPRVSLHLIEYPRRNDQYFLHGG